jgi:hypothetical protein
VRDVKDALDRIQPRPNAAGDWGAVLRDARVRRRRPALTRPLAAVAAAAAVLFALALFQPWEGENPTFLERALAAVDDGPVLHVVLRGEWGGTLVDLETGERAPVHGENEIWYDPARRLVHQSSRLGRVVQYEDVYEPRKPPAELVALGREYREALESGSARVADDDVIDGERVTWITLRRSMDLDVADDRLHEWTQQVAVSRETFKPVALRETRDGEPGAGTFQRVLELEMLPSGQGDFTASEDATLEGRVFKEGREAIALEQANETLGRTPLWLGRAHEGLSLAEAFRTTRAIGGQREIRVEGPVAREAERCSELRGEAGARCFRALDYPKSLAVRPDGVFTHGPTVWDTEQIGVQLFYGSVGDDPSTYRKDVLPLYDQPYVAITQTTQRSPFQRGAGRYVPPEGSIFIAARGRAGFLRVGDLYVTVEASTAERILSAARALEPMLG